MSTLDQYKLVFFFLLVFSRIPLKSDARGKKGKNSDFDFNIAKVANNPAKMIDVFNLFLFEKLESGAGAECENLADLEAR